MAAFECLIYAGACYAIEWGTDATDRCQARDYYDSLEDGDRAVAAMMAWLAEEAHSE